MIKEITSKIISFFSEPFIEPVIEAVEETYPKWLFYGDYNKKVTIPLAVRSRNVWIISPNGKTICQLDYLTARRIRAKHHWYINIKEPKMPQSAALNSIISMVPTLIMIAFLASVTIKGFFGLKDEELVKEVKL